MSKKKPKRGQVPANFKSLEPLPSKTKQGKQPPPPAKKSGKSGKKKG